MDMNNKFFGASFSEEEIKLIQRIEENSDLFQDMLFAPGTISCDLTSFCSTNGIDLSDDLLPEQLSSFGYEWFSFHVSDLGDTCGEFDKKNQSLTVSPSSLENDSVILHEMIHLHEFVLNDLPLFFHDAYLWSIYKSLQSQIPDLDTMIKSHCHLHNENSLYMSGGLHDLLFLLKSYDLDLRKGYPLGTVFGYGYDSTP